MKVADALAFRPSWNKICLDGVMMTMKEAKKHSSKEVARQKTDYATSTLYIWTK